MNAYSIGYKLYSWSDVTKAHVVARTPEKACDALRKAKRRNSSSLVIISVEQAFTDVVVAK